MRVAGGRRELEKKVNTSTTKWRKQNFPRGKPPTKKGLKSFQGSLWKNNKKWIEHILKNN
jgi:hypothetical protein